MSQELVKSTSRAIGLPWNEHWAGSTVTVILAVFWAAASLGLAASVSAPNSGKYVTTARARPAMMMGLRPILSDSVPNTTKNGVPMISDTATRMLAVEPSTFSTFCRKNSA